MYQSFRMILWSKVNKEEFGNSAEKAYKIMQLLRAMGSELYPKYECVYRKRDAKEFEWNYENFENLVKRGVNKEGKNIFLESGYSIDFFSSLEESESAEISMSIGTSDPKFINTFILRFPQTYDFQKLESNTEYIEGLFKNAINILEPFWGCIANSANSRRFESYIKNNLPTSIHWFTFLGKDIVNNIGKNRVINAPVYAVEKLEDGYFIKLDKAPLNDNNIEDLNKQSKVNNYLGL